MKKNIFIFIISIALWSCKTNIATTTTNAIKSESLKSENHLFKALAKKSEFQTLKIESKIIVENESFIPPTNAIIYIEKGHKVWINITAMFFNVARGIATPQGIKGYEKIGKTYIDSDFGYLNQLMNVNFIDYHSLQNLLVGKVFFPINEQDFSLTSINEGYKLVSSNNQKIIAKGKSYEYHLNLSFSHTFDLESILMTEINTGDQLKLYYTNWTTFEGERLPQNVKIIIKGKKNTQIIIENTNFGSSKMETPYSVPKNYTKKEF